MPALTPQPDDPEKCPDCDGPRSACITIASHPYMAEISKLIEGMPDCVEKDAIEWAHGQIVQSAKDMAALSGLCSESAERSMRLIFKTGLREPSETHATLQVNIVRALDGIGKGAHAALVNDFDGWYDTLGSSE